MWLRFWVIALILVGCASPDGPPGLLNVADFVPREADVGDRLEVIGTGFPEGRTATLTFRGDLHRPGQEPVRDVEIVAPANSRSSSRIGFVLNEKLQEQLCGGDERGAHTTFRGDVIAAFAPKKPGAPPITGVVHDVVVDIAAPTVAPKLAEERRAEGQRAAEYFGIHLEDEEERGGVVVKEVVETSRAERAGVLAGDRIVGVDGLRVRGLADLAPAATGRTAELEVARGEAKAMLRIDVEGFRPAAPKDLATAAGLIGVIALLLALGASPLSRLIGFVARRAALRLSARRRLTKELGQRLRRRVSDDEESEGLFARLVPYFAFVGISAAGTVIAFGRPLVQVDLDFGLWVVALVTLSVVGKLVSGGIRARQRWSLLAGLGGALRGLLLCVPLIAALVAVVILTGNLRFADAVNQQGVWPWKWTAFSNPVLLLGLAAVLASVSVPISTRCSNDALRLDAERTSERLEPTEWVTLLLTCQLAAIVFLGGWRLPSTGAFVAGGLWLSAAGALVLQLKAWGLAASVLLVRWLLPVVPREQLIDVWWRRILPLTLGVVIGTAAWARGAQSPWLVSVEPLFGYVLFAVLLISLVSVLARVRLLTRVGATRAHVNPWL